MRRYVLALVTFGVTIAAVLSILFGETNDPGSMIIATIGMPVSVLLLTRAVLTPPEGTRPGVGSFIFGATVVPSAVLLLGALATGVLVAATDPLRAAVVDLGNELNASSDFLDILFAGWAFLVIVELAFVAPLLEETLKPFGALVARPRTRSEALLFGAAAGAGFAAMRTSPTRPAGCPADSQALHLNDLLDLGVADPLAENSFGHLGIVADGFDVIRIVDPEQAPHRRTTRHRDIVTIEQALVDQKAEDLLPASRIQRRAVEGHRVGVVIDESHLRCEPPPTESPPPPPDEATEADNRVWV